MGVCTKFNDLCNGTNPNTGACLACYQGYVLLDGDCVVAQQSAVSSQADPYCIKFENNRCTKCSSGFYLNQSGICQQADPLCKTPQAPAGDCLECYQGYVPNGKTCVIPVQVQIPYCSITGVTGTCV